MAEKRKAIRAVWVISMMLGGLWLLLGEGAVADPAPVDPARITGPDACGRDCHKNELAIWQRSKHFLSFRAMERNNKVGEILSNLGLQPPMRRAEACIGCHYTQQVVGGRAQPTTGVSCEDCHGAAANWIKVHGDYGGEGVRREQETPAHRQQRINLSNAAGYIRPGNLYALARRCYDCHLGIEERLVNVGGHAPGSLIELVQWTQGQVSVEDEPIRHNVHFTQENNYASPERRRVMYVLGRALELEYALRGVARATENGLFAKRMAQQAKLAAGQLKNINETVAIPEVSAILEQARQVQLRLGQGPQLTAIADAIAAQAKRFAARETGAGLAALDAAIPWRP